VVAEGGHQPGVVGHAGGELLGGPALDHADQPPVALGPHLVVGSTVLGAGTPIFGAPVAGLALEDTRRFDGSSNVVFRYAIAHG
jgi:hypothetical protein